MLLDDDPDDNCSDDDRKGIEKKTLMMLIADDDKLGISSPITSCSNPKSARLFPFAANLMIDHENVLFAGYIINFQAYLRLFH